MLRSRSYQVATRDDVRHRTSTPALCQPFLCKLLGGGAWRARLQLLQQLLALNHVPKHRVAPVQQVGAAGRQLRLLAHTTVCGLYELLHYHDRQPYSCKNVKML